MQGGFQVDGGLMVVEFFWGADVIDGVMLDRDLISIGIRYHDERMRGVFPVGLEGKMQRFYVFTTAAYHKDKSIGHGFSFG
jgi:hypothetical protein